MDEPITAKAFVPIRVVVRTRPCGRPDVPWTEIEANGGEVTFRPGSVEVHGQVFDSSWDVVIRALEPLP